MEPAGRWRILFSASFASSASIACAIVACTSSYAFAAGRPITVPDLLSMQRISDPQVSPDGTRVLYTVAVPDIAANRTARSIWTAPLAGGEPRALTTTGHDGNARWSPDGRRIAFVSMRSGSAQLFVMSADATGEAKQLTAIAGGVDRLVWAPDGRSIAFVSDVFPDCKDDSCNAARDQAREASMMKARVYDRLLYRHWTSWSEGKRSHLFIVASEGGTPRDLIPAADYDVPPREREGPHPIAFAPDSKTICFTAVTDAVEAASTNADLFEIDASGGATKKLTTNPGFDGAPVYSPDGRTIAYRSQAHPGYESDKWRLMVLDRASGRPTSLTDAFDRSADTPHSLEFFSALQRQGVPSRLIVFPDEGHWVLKPQNSEFWYQEFLRWLAQYLAPESPSTRSAQGVR
jgi:dipeptidyl aminopeptidase/acylaminoacyl peptidase